MNTTTFFILWAILLSHMIYGQTFAGDKIHYTIEYGALTYHYSSYGNYNYKNTVGGNKSLVNNSTAIISMSKYDGLFYNKLSLIVGEDCIGSPVFGVGWASGIYKPSFDLGWILGAYRLDPQAWKTQTDIDQYWFEISKNNGIVPIVGFELNYYPIRTEKFRIGIMNKFTPIMSIHTVGIQFSF